MMTMCLLLLLSMVVVGQAAGKDLTLQATPKFLLVAKWNGEVMRCVYDYDKPNECEVLKICREPRIISSTIVHGEHLYVACDDDGIVQCSWHKMNSCKLFHRVKSYLPSLVVSAGYLFAGLYDGTILRCEFGRLHSCVTVHKFSKNFILKMYAYDKYIYVANIARYISKCSQEANFSCTQVEVNNEADVLSVSRYRNNIITTYYGKNLMMYHDIKSDGSVIFKKDVLLPDTPSSITIFNKKLYVLTPSEKILEYEVDNENNFKELVQHNKTYSISFAYGVHHIRNTLVQSDDKLCSRQPRPSAVFNYREEHRRVVEATVVDGELRDSRGAAVDTRNADVGYSGRVAVFAMGPDGQLLLSTSHRSGLIHITSFFAGSPVSGAGEMIVEDGVVKKIITCSEYYLPDSNLNKQVVDALWTKGYTRANEIILEECVYTCDEE